MFCFTRYLTAKEIIPESLGLNKRKDLTVSYRRMDGRTDPYCEKNFVFSNKIKSTENICFKIALVWYIVVLRMYFGGTTTALLPLML